jgi:hypothetical protein
LEWLLLEGHKILVRDYDVRYGGYRTSRSGKALMFFKEKGKFQVDPNYSGTRYYNWITKAFETVDDDLRLALESAVQELV